MRSPEEASPSAAPTLKCDWASFDAAEYAVHRWHYSRALPSAKMARIGVWENGVFIGVVLFGNGATPHLSKPYGLKMDQVAELVRIALDKHVTPVSRILSISCAMLRKQFPKLRLLISFADTEQGHVGRIYQASGWRYTGHTGTQRYFRVHGTVVHPRSLGSKYGLNGQSLGWLRSNIDPGTEVVEKPPKFRYVYPLDKGMLKFVDARALPHPRDLSAVAVVDRSPLPGGIGVQTDLTAPSPPAS